MVKLGEGHHFGEWWGSGINRNYGLDRRRFSLFNLSRWQDKTAELPTRVSLVPKLYEGPLDLGAIRDILHMLGADGSVAAPGFMRPEGICLFHTASRQIYKVTLEHDEKPKSQAK